ncbi:hypothetical protein GCM10011386_25770 [Parapedobacter defluvii]|uniref:YdhG-like domain-containing protein n=1 Tax=Parapedobacter defluvii TaxID=2045106 RepID=A0ABQ1M272_9SPHI|nr:DUF1801 domain-containing protein [Parapedobacter defluvii]GGC32458.1 hypothetical protein GCM10011386_25770 [Parapedobacter defluvii]
MENTQANNINTVNQYLTSIGEDSKRALLERLRAIIKQAVPEADEVISYKMPTYKYNGILIYFAAWKNHWALYPANATLKETFKEELSRYKQTKGAIHFPWEEPLPEALITRLVKKRAAENKEKAKAKAKPSKR